MRNSFVEVLYKKILIIKRHVFRENAEAKLLIVELPWTNHIKSSPGILFLDGKNILLGDIGSWVLEYFTSGCNYIPRKNIPRPTTEFTPIIKNFCLEIGSQEKDIYVW